MLFVFLNKSDSLPHAGVVWRVLCLIVLCSGPTLASTPDRHPFIPPDATVVLMTGLPGDLESETQYRQGMEAWLQLLREATPRRHIVQLSGSKDLENPAPLPGERLQKLRAERSTFLSLGEQLSKGTNGLVFIVWGHGGMEGSTPVFHVRGPRITASDFRKLSEQTRPRDVHWVLLFKGSGAFARVLAHEHNLVLASEGAKSFTTDPICMRILLQESRDGLQTDFAEVARQVMVRTKQWYAERGLAQTEQPTFWGSEPTPGPQELPREMSAQPRTSQSSDRRRPNQPEVPAAEPSPAGDSAMIAWANVSPVEAQSYPGQAGVILQRRLAYVLGRDPAVSSEQEDFIQILTAEGKQLGDFDLSYSPPGEELDVLDCEVRQPDGKLVRLNPGTIREAVSGTLGQFEIGRRKVFSLPGVAPGAILRVRYRTQWRHFPLPEIYLELPLRSDLPMRDFSLQITTARHSPFHFGFMHTAASEPQIEERGYGRSYRWRFSDVPAKNVQALTPPDSDPKLALSTFGQWATFSEWYSRIIRMTDQITPAIKAEAEELTHAARTPKEKVLQLYNYVTAMRYVAVPMGIRSVRPHPAESVRENQFGDCKDKANLFNTCLRALGIKADLVLVPRFKTAHEGVPGMAFNHAISRVTIGGETLWIDTTDDICRFGLLPPGDAGRKALVIDGTTTNLIRLPIPAAEDNRLELDLELSGEPSGHTLAFSMGAVAKGMPDYQMRAEARVRRSEGTIGLLLDRLYRPMAGVFILHNQTNTPASALDQDFSWLSEGEAIGLLSTNRGGWLVQAPFWIPREWDLALHSRSEPLFLGEGCPLKMRQRFTLNIGVSRPLATIPFKSGNQEGPLMWELAWEALEPGKLRATLQATLVKGELDVGMVRKFQLQLQDLLRTVSRPLWISLEQAN